MTWMGNVCRPKTIHGYIEEASSGFVHGSRSMESFAMYQAVQRASDGHPGVVMARGQELWSNGKGCMYL